MVDSDDHDVAELRQLRAVVTGSVARAGGETAAVEGNHYGALLAVVHAGSPDVKGETILAHAADVQVPLDEHGVVAVQIRRRLGADRSMAEALTHASPRGGLFGRHVAVPAAGGRAVGDAFESVVAMPCT